MPRVILQPELQPFPRWGWAQATAWFTGRDANEERVAWLERLRGSFGLRPCGEGWLLTGAPEDKVFGAEGDLLMVRLRFPVLVLQPVSEEIFDFADDEVEEEC